jgi:hypothetical protein
MACFNKEKKRLKFSGIEFVIIVYLTLPAQHFFLSNRYDMAENHKGS